MTEVSKVITLDLEISLGLYGKLGMPKDLKGVI